MRIIDNIEGENIYEMDDNSVTWRGKMAVDSDGVGDHHGDHTAQDQTSYKPYLNADEDKYIVVPPAIRDGVTGVVMGCQAHCVNVMNGMSTDAVVGDIGPHRKLGEASCATNLALGLNPSPVDGGTENHIIQYTIYPGKAAVVDGKQYTLQPA
jgi:hypothetical protein